MKSNNHDNFVRAAFSNPAHAASLVQTFLGQDFIEEFGRGLVHVSQDTFVDTELRRHETDLLFRFEGKSTLVHVYVLMEHQSTVFAMMPVRLNRYLCKIQQSFAPENSAFEKIPAIVPIVLYNGARKWQGPTTLFDCFDESGKAFGLAGLRNNDLEFKLVNLADYADAKLGNSRQGISHGSVLALLLLKHCRDNHFSTRLRTWRRLIGLAYRESQGEFLIQAAICYILQTTDAAKQDLIENIVPQTRPEMETVIRTQAQIWMEEGESKGLREGKQEGKREGAREATIKALIVVLNAKFGALDKTHEKTIDQSEIAKLERFLERAVAADSVAQVFGD